MKTSSSYRDRTGRNSSISRSYRGNQERYSDYNDSYNRIKRGDDDEPFAEDRSYYNSYDRDNRRNNERNNAYDRTHTSPQRGDYGYERYNREQYEPYRSTAFYNHPSDSNSRRRYGSRFNEDNNYRYEGPRNSERFRDFDEDNNRARAYGDKSYYDPSDTYKRRDERGYTYRYDEDYERELRHPGRQGRYSWGREDEDRSKGNYGYYESYPSYGQSSAYNDHERYSGKTGRYRNETDQYGETDYEDYRKPNIRDRNFW